MKFTKDKKKHIHIRISEEEKRKVDEKAKEENKTSSDFIREAILEKVKKK